METDFKFPFYAKASLVVIGLFAFISMLFITQRIVVPIIYSTIIAIVLSPVVDYFSKKGINRIIVISVTLILMIIITVLIVSLLSSQLIQFSDSFPTLITRFHELLDNTILWASNSFNIGKPKIDLWISEKDAEILNGTGAFIGRTIMDTGSVLIVLILIPVYAFMILFYQPLLLEFIHRVFRLSNQREVNEVLLATKKIIRSYLVGLLLEAAIMAVLYSSSLLALGIDYAILLGVIGAIFNVIPYVGGIVAIALPMMIVLATKSSSYCLLVLVFFITIQFIDNHYIKPKVVASKVKINAMISIIVVLAGGALWGLSGMFLSIPLTGIIKVVFDHIESLKPWGYLLGDTMPPIQEVKSISHKK